MARFLDDLDTEGLRSASFNSFSPAAAIVLICTRAPCRFFVATSGFKSRTRPIGRRKTVSCTDRGDQPAVGQPPHCFLDHCRGEIGGKRPRISSRSSPRQSALPARNRLPHAGTCFRCFRIKADGVGQQRVDREVRREPEAAAALCPQRRLGHFNCHVARTRSIAARQALGGMNASTKRRITESRRSRGTQPKSSFRRTLRNPTRTPPGRFDV